MITAKQLYNTYPHRQMRAYIEDVIHDVWRRPDELGKLTKKFLRNFEDQDGGWDLEDVNVVPRDIDSAFIWGDTPEGHGFWSRINGYRPAPVEPKMVKPKPAAPKVAAKKKVGWW